MTVDYMEKFGHNLIAKDVYIFRWREGQLFSYKGSVYQWGRSRARCYADTVVDPEQHPNTGLNCSLNPSEINNYILWLYEDNPSLAMGFFMNYEEDQIAHIREKFEVHQRRLQQMRETDTSHREEVESCP